MLRPVAALVDTVDFTVIERPAPATPVSVAPPPPLARAKPKREARAVFGISKKTLVAAGADSSVAVKPGNTIAKKQDTEALRPEDEDALPTPADEFLVSQMPTLADEIRIPYPTLARKNGVEGAVVMDILVDNAGAVRDAKLVSGPGSGLDEAALEAVKRFKFKPAIIDGKPVAVRIRYAYRFVLEH